MLLLTASVVQAQVAPPIREGYVDAGQGVRLFFRLVGSGRDTVVVIHGGPGFSMEYFSADLAPLAERHTLLFYDQRGAGRSTLVRDSLGLTGERFAEDLEAIRRHFRMERLSILGHSWGAGVAALYGSRYPERVGRLLIANGIPLQRQELARAFAQLDSSRPADERTRMQQRMAARKANPGDKEACVAYYLLWFRPFFADPSAMRRTKGDFCAGTPESRRNKIESVDRYTAASLGEWDWRAGVRKIAAPTLVLHGTVDPLPLGGAREWAATLPNARLLVLDHIGHFPYLEAPDRFFPAVNEFLNGSWPEGAEKVGERNSTADIPIDSAGLSRILDSAMAQGMARESIPGAAFILVKNGRIVLARGFGRAELESRRAWSPEHTIFPIASITKVFTATAVMQLVDRGRIQLDRNVNRYLTSVQVPPTYPQPVTPAHLLSHTAGFDEIPGRQAGSPAKVVPLGRFLRDRLVRVHRPGEMTSYSSYGAALAGLLVQDVSSLSFEDFLQRHIWRPLGMTRTSLERPKEKDSAFATAYQLEDGKLRAIPYEIYQTPPTASIVSTLEDMARFMASHLHNGRQGTTRILSDTAAEKMHRQHVTMHPRVPGWTLGFQVNDLNGRRIIEHGGDIGGFSSLMTLLPDDGVGFLVAHHLEGRNLRFDIRQLILDRYFPDSRQPQPPKQQQANAAGLRRFEGKYRPSIFCHSCRGSGPNFGEFEVSANEDGSISLWDERWFQVSPRFFVSADGRSRIGFAEDGSGRIFALTAGSWRVLERVH